MPRIRFKDQRLLLAFPLREGARIDASRDQANYLLNVLRMGAGDTLLVFNGQDGEWTARIADVSRRGCALEIVEKIREQTKAADLHYLFAPLKQARLDYMVQKAVEMGVSALRPVITRHTQVGRVNTERMVGNVVEAAEQCGILNLAEVREPIELAPLLERWPESDPGRRLLFCDEGEDSMNPLPRLVDIARGPLAVLIGPEGGFSEDERRLLTAQSFVTAIPLGPRILRADTAAVAALAVVQATLGDWI